MGMILPIKTERWILSQREVFLLVPSCQNQKQVCQIVVGTVKQNYQVWFFTDCSLCLRMEQYLAIFILNRDPSLQTANIAIFLIYVAI